MRPRFSALPFRYTKPSIGRPRVGLQPRLRWIRSLGLAVAVIAGITSSCRAATLPPGVTEFDVTNDLTHIWGEPEVAINPKNPSNLVYAVLGNGYTKPCREKATKDPNSGCTIVKTAFGPLPLGLMDNRSDFTHASVYVTFDRGKTWKRISDIPGRIPLFPSAIQGPGVSADPMIAAGPDGTFYLAWDASHMVNRPDSFSDFGGIATSKSTDGGRTWSKPVFTGTAVDRPFLQVDTSTGVIYEASTGPVPGPWASGDPNTPPGTNDRHLTSSKDGVHWTTPQPFGGGALQIASARGALAATLNTNDKNSNLCGNAPAPCMIFQTTKNAGATWERHVMPNSVPSDARPRVMVAADPDKAGHFAVALFADADTKIAVYQTRDAGNTWSAPAMVTDDANKTHYHAWMAYSPKGVLGLMWKSRNAPPGGPTAAPINVFAAISRNGGSTFSQPLRVNAEENAAPDPDPHATGGDDFSYLAMGMDELFVAYATTGDRVGMLADVKFSAFGQ